MSPFLRTVVLQLTHQGAGRQEHEVHMPGLARAAPPLTIAHAHMLRPVAMIWSLCRSGVAERS